MLLYNTVQQQVAILLRMRNKLDFCDVQEVVFNDREGESAFEMASFPHSDSMKWDSKNKWNAGKSFFVKSK